MPLILTAKITQPAVYLTPQHFQQLAARDVPPEQSGPEPVPLNISVSVVGETYTESDVHAWLTPQVYSSVVLPVSLIQRLGKEAVLEGTCDISRTPAITLQYGGVELQLQEGLMAPRRYIRINPHTAESYGLREGDTVYVGPSSDARRGRTLVFGDTLVILRSGYQREFRIDADEAAAAQLKENDNCVLVDTAPRREALPESQNKRIITEAHIRRAHVKREPFAVQPNDLLTPAAKDYARRYGYL